MKKIITLFSLISLILFTGACNKYEEGPALSLRTKTQRVANNWKIAQALDNGEDVTTGYNKYELDLTKNGGASLSLEYELFGTDYKYETSGTWDFVSNKEKISLDFENDLADGVYRILRLKEKEMWLKDEDGNIEVHLVPR